MNLSSLKKAPSNRENVDNCNEPFPVSRSKVSHRLEAARSLQISFICVLMGNVSNCRMCVLVSKFCGLLYIFCRRTFPRAFGGDISKAKFLFGHPLDVIDLMDRMDRTGAASRPL